MPSLKRAPVHLTLALAMCAAPAGALAQQPGGAPPVVGTWTGALALPSGLKLRLVLHVKAGEDGTLTGTMDSPDQGATGIPLSAVTVDRATVHFELASVGAAFVATLEGGGTRLVGTWQQGGGSLPLTLEKGGAPAAPPPRPQEPTPPYPYRVEDVTVPTPDPDVRLAGTLTLPRGNGPFPAVVLVSGSGPQDRNEALLGHKPFLVLADYLTRKGIAVLRYDDRGVGGSTGAFKAATSQDFTSDALAVVDFARARPEIEDDGVGIAGHSEGGLIGPMAAVRSDHVAFVVMLAGPGLPGRDILHLQSELINRAEGAGEATVEANRKIQDALFDVVASEPDSAAAVPRLHAALDSALAELPPDVRERIASPAGQAAIKAQLAQVNSPWFRFFLTHDPRPTLEKVKVPVLALNGSKDLQVPPEQNLAAIREALARGATPTRPSGSSPGSTTSSSTPAPDRRPSTRPSRKRSAPRPWT